MSASSLWAAPALHLVLAIVCAIGLIERVAAGRHGDGLGGAGWAWVSAAVMLVGVVVCARSYVVARRERGARAAEAPTIPA